MEEGSRWKKEGTDRRKKMKEGRRWKKEEDGRWKMEGPEGRRWR